MGPITKPCPYEKINKKKQEQMSKLYRHIFKLQAKVIEDKKTQIQQTKAEQSKPTSQSPKRKSKSPESDTNHQRASSQQKHFQPEKRNSLAPYYHRYLPCKYPYQRDQEPLSQILDFKNVGSTSHSFRNKNLKTAQSFTKIKSPLVNEAIIYNQKLNQDTMSDEDKGHSPSSKRIRSKSALPRGGNKIHNGKMFIVNWNKSSYKQLQPETAMNSTQNGSDSLQFLSAMQTRQNKDPISQASYQQIQSKEPIYRSRNKKSPDLADFSSLMNLSAAAKEQRNNLNLSSEFSDEMNIQ